MTPPNGLEERVAKLEAEVAELKKRLAPPTDTAEWLERISGSMKDNPAFDEAMRLAREFRQADRPKDDEE
jgi:hypothetical protein